MQPFHPILIRVASKFVAQRLEIFHGLLLCGARLLGPGGDFLNPALQVGPDQKSLFVFSELADQFLGGHTLGLC